MFCGQRKNASYRIIAECQEMIDSKFLHDRTLSISLLNVITKSKTLIAENLNKI